MTATPRIVIVGAGPGGLICGVLLRQHHLDITIFDRDQSHSARDQGGMLDLHGESDSPHCKL